MGSPKAALEWHGSTLLRRTAGILSRATAGPVVVVRAAGQDLPPLPPQVEIADDPREGMGPLQGIAAGLAAIGDRAEYAFVCSTDLPFLHPAFVTAVLRAVQAGGAAGRDDRVPPPDVALPVAGGFAQPLAAAYRTALAGQAAELVADGRLRPGFLFDLCTVLRLDADALLADPVLAALDPDLDSVANVNDPADYLAARQRPAPLITTAWSGGWPAGHPRPAMIRAATLGHARAAASAALPGGQVLTMVNGEAARDDDMPLARGDSVLFVATGSGLRRSGV
jgi:molybdenum cofactor guanylyltransferase